MRTLLTCSGLLVALFGLLLLQGVGREATAGAAPGLRSAPVERGPGKLAPGSASGANLTPEGAGLERLSHGPRRAVLSRSNPAAAPELFVQFLDPWGEPLRYLRTRVIQAPNVEKLASTGNLQMRVADSQGRLQVSGAEGLWGAVLGLEPQVEGLQRIVIDPRSEIDEYVNGVRPLRLEVGYWRVEVLDGRNLPSGGSGSWTYDLDGLAPEPVVRAYFGPGALRGASGLPSGSSRPTRQWSRARAGETLMVARELGGRSLWARLQDGSYAILLAPRVGKRSQPGVLQLPMHSPGVLLRGRLAPEFAGSELTVVDLVGEGTSASQARVSVDAEGDFVVSTSLSHSASVVAVHLTGRRGTDGRAFGGSTTLSPPLGVPGLRDLGRVEVELLPLLVEGTLAGLTGSASVRESSDRPPDVFFYPGTMSLGPSNDILGLGLGREPMSMTERQRLFVYGVSSRSARGSGLPIVVDPVDSSGRFRAWGRWPDDTAWLWVGGEPIVEFEVGARGLREEGRR